MVKSHIHYMDHVHFTDIDHGHTINDPGHGHDTPMNIFSSNASQIVDNSVPGIWGNAQGVNHNYSHANTTGITVNPTGTDYKVSTESRYLGNQGVNRQYTESNDANAIENRPKNYTVKIWKRMD